MSWNLIRNLVFEHERTCWRRFNFLWLCKFVKTCQYQLSDSCERVQVENWKPEVYSPQRDSWHINYCMICIFCLMIVGCWTTEMDWGKFSTLWRPQLSPNSLSEVWKLQIDTLRSSRELFCMLTINRIFLILCTQIINSIDDLQPQMTPGTCCKLSQEINERFALFMTFKLRDTICRWIFSSV